MMLLVHVEQYERGTRHERVRHKSREINPYAIRQTFVEDGWDKG